MRSAVRAVSPLAAAGTVQVVHRYAADTAFTRDLVTTSRTCPAANASCWYRPKETFYWQVSISGAVQATSRTSLVSVSGPRAALDRARPFVRALSGMAWRGRRALFAARVADDSGEARLRAELARGGLTVAEGQTAFAPAPRGARRRVRTARLPALHHRLGPGGQPEPSLRAVPGSLAGPAH